MHSLPPKPSRTTTKRLVIGNNVAAWVAFVVVAILAPATMGDVAWPLVFIIVGILGWYTGTNSFDLHSLAKIAQARSAATSRRHGRDRQDAER